MSSESVPEFFAAIQGGEAAEVEAALEADPGLASARNEDGVSAVLMALYMRQEEIFDLLLERSPELDLFEAAAAGDTERLKQHLDENPNATEEFSKDGFNALGLAAYFGRVESAEILLQRGADPNVEARNQTRTRPIHSAIANRDHEAALAMARLLVDNGAEVDIAQEGGWTPLHQAAAHGQTQVVEMLLANGARPGRTSDDGRTASDMAREAGHQQVAERLAG